MEAVRIPLAKIERFGGREVDAATVAALKESLTTIGLRSPVTVVKKTRHDGPGEVEFYWLVAGRHRVEAARDLHWEDIDAFVVDMDDKRAELWEIDENLVRAELSDAQRARAHARRAQLMADLGLAPPRGHGGDRRSSAKSALEAYPAQAAAALGVSKRTVQQDLARGERIAPEVLAAVTGTDMDKGVVLDELARVPRVEQPARLDEIRARKESHKVNREHNRVIALTDAEQFAEWLLERTDMNELPTIISWLEGTKPRDVIAALRREAA